MSCTRAILWIALEKKLVWNVVQTLASCRLITAFQKAFFESPFIALISAGRWFQREGPLKEKAYWPFWDLSKGSSCNNSSAPLVPWPCKLTGVRSVRYLGIRLFTVLNMMQARWSSRLFFKKGRERSWCVSSEWAKRFLHNIILQALFWRICRWLASEVGSIP